ASEELQHLLLAGLAGLRPAPLLEERRALEGGADDRAEHERLVRDLLREAVAALGVAEEETADRAVAADERERERGAEAERGAERTGGRGTLGQLVLERGLAGERRGEHARRRIERQPDPLGDAVAAEDEEPLAPGDEEPDDREVEEHGHVGADDARDA